MTMIGVSALTDLTRAVVEIDLKCKSCNKKTLHQIFIRQKICKYDDAKETLLEQKCDPQCTSCWKKREPSKKDVDFMVKHLYAMAYNMGKISREKEKNELY